MTHDEANAEWVEWANRVFCGDKPRSADSGPAGGFKNAAEVRGWLASKLNRRHRHRWVYQWCYEHGSGSRPDICNQCFIYTATPEDEA